MNLEDFFELVVEKTKEGVEKLKTTEMGTEEYEILISQIISNINLVRDKDILVYGENAIGQQPQQEQFDSQKWIGEDFE